jgi:adenylosuccinate synthase
LNMQAEAECLDKTGICTMREAFARTSVHEKCVLITPFQRAVNRLKELERGSNRHGSCGQGVGQAREDHLNHGSDVLFVGDLQDEQSARRKLRFLQEISLSVVQYLDLPRSEVEKYEILVDPNADEILWEIYRDIPLNIYSDEDFCSEMANAKTVVFEGAQGVLLDETHGTPPYNTWTNTTFDNANLLLNEIDTESEVTRIGVLRAYATRHGAGPLPTEDPALQSLFPEPHNSSDGFQGEFRVGCFDIVSTQKALTIIDGVDEIAMNHLDYFSDEFADTVENLLNVSITLRGFGPTALDRRYEGVRQNA